MQMPQPGYLVPVLALVVFAVACGNSAPPGERVLAMLEDERSYTDALEAASEDEEHAIGGYRNRLAMFSLGASMSENLEWDVCQAGIPLERQAIEERKSNGNAAAAPLWERYAKLIDRIEALLCKEYGELTNVGGRYIGPVGDFRVNQGKVHDGDPCSASAGEFGPFPSDFLQSELWLDAFSTSARPNFCSDDDRLLAIFEYRDTAILKRGYFYQAPLSVGFNELREPPQLLEVAGRPAIVGIEAPPSEQVFLYVIERFPTDDVAGIFVFVMGAESDPALASEIAEELLP